MLGLFGWNLQPWHDATQFGSADCSIQARPALGAMLAGETATKSRFESIVTSAEPMPDQILRLLLGVLAPTDLPEEPFFADVGLGADARRHRVSCQEVLVLG